MARRMRGPTLAQLMQARAEGGYAASTPAESTAPTDAEIAAMQAEMQATGAPPAPQPVQLQLGQAPTPEQQAALWGRRGAPVGQTVSPNEFGPPPMSPGAAAAQQVVGPAAGLGTSAPAQSQDDVLQGLLLKSYEANPASKTFVRLPDEVRAQMGDQAPEGFDTATLSIAEKVALRRMGIKFPGAPRARPRAVPAQRAAPTRLDRLMQAYSPYQHKGVQEYYKAYGAPPLMRGSPEAEKLRKFLPEQP